MKSWNLRLKILVGELSAVIVLALAITVGISSVNWTVRREATRLTVQMQTPQVDVVTLAHAMMGGAADAQLPMGVVLK